MREVRVRLHGPYATQTEMRGDIDDVGVLPRFRLFWLGSAPSSSNLHISYVKDAVKFFLISKKYSLSVMTGYMSAKVCCKLIYEVFLNKKITLSLR